MNVNISEREAEIAREILESAYRELLLEIARAEHHDFRAVLQEREKLLQALLEKLGSLAPAHL
jgi:hypothetical protein